MTNTHDAIKYGWTEELAKDFFYEKCHGYPEDIIKSINELILGVVEAQKIIEKDSQLLEQIPF